MSGDAIAFALMRSRKIIRGLKEGLTEEERYAVADHAVAQLKERGDPWRLNEEATRHASLEHKENTRASRASCKPREWTARGSFFWRSNVEPGLTNRPCRCLFTFSARLRSLWCRTQDVAV